MATSLAVSDVESYDRVIRLKRKFVDSYLAWRENPDEHSNDMKYKRALLDIVYITMGLQDTYSGNSCR